MDEQKNIPSEPNQSKNQQKINAMDQQLHVQQSQVQKNIQLQYKFTQPTKNPEEVFANPKTASVNPQQNLISTNTIQQNTNPQQEQIDDNKSIKSNKSQSSQQQSLGSKKRKGSFLQRLSQKQQQEEQKLNQKRKQDQKAIFLENVDYKATKQQLELLFQDCAKIARVTILKDPFTNHPKGCAYILFDTEQGVQRALHLSGITLRNRTIKVHRKRTNLPGIYGAGNKILGVKKDQMSGLGMNILGMMQNFTRNTGSNIRGRGRGGSRGR